MFETPSTPNSIIGTWEPVRGELDAEPVPELVIRQTVVEFTAETYVVHFNGGLADRGNYMLSQANPHPVLSLEGLEGANAGRKIPAIYQAIGERLRICYGLGGALPTEFATRANSERYLVIYRRVK